MRGNDALRDRKAEAGALADRLGREERLEDAREVLGSDARSIVLDGDGQSFEAVAAERGIEIDDAA